MRERAREREGGRDKEKNFERNREDLKKGGGGGGGDR